MVSPAPTGTGGTLTNNLVNLVSSLQQGGSPTYTDNVQLCTTGCAAGWTGNAGNTGPSATLLAQYQAALPNYPSSSMTSAANRAAAIHVATPANLAAGSGGVVNLDGSVAGALWPADHLGKVCWATTAVFDASVDCTSVSSLAQ